jgi:hypothetical protein
MKDVENGLKKIEKGMTRNIRASPKINKNETNDNESAKIIVRRITSDYYAIL